MKSFIDFVNEPIKNIVKNENESRLDETDFDDLLVNLAFHSKKILADRSSPLVIEQRISSIRACLLVLEKQNKKLI